MLSIQVGPKLHGSLAARIDDLDKRLSMISETMARHERTAKEEATLDSVVSPVAEMTQATSMEIHRSVDSQRIGHVADHEQGTAASTVGLAQSGESYLSESMLQRFEAMETSIAAVSSSVRSPGVDHLLERLRALENGFDGGLCAREHRV